MSIDLISSPLDAVASLFQLAKCPTKSSNDFGVAHHFTSELVKGGADQKV